MRVKLKAQISGTRDGVSWPPVGTVVELPDDEARSMMYAGTAEALNDRDRHEPVVTMPDNVEDATEKFIPETARHEPAVGIENLPDEDRRPNMAAIGLDDSGEIAHGPSTDDADNGDEPVDMAAEAASGEPRRTRRVPTAAKSGPVTTKTGPVKKPAADGDK